jgi:hypothetical protein
MPSYLWERKQIVEDAECMLMSKREAQDRRQRPEVPHPNLARVQA